MSLVAFKIFSLVLSDIDISEHQPFFFFFLNKLFIYFGSAGSSLLCPGFLEWQWVGLFFAAGLRLLIAVASPVGEHRL